MITRPYDLTVTEAELSQANVWWRSLSINEMKSYQAKHFPTWWDFPSKRMVHQIWEEEGKPTLGESHDRS